LLSNGAVNISAATKADATVHELEKKLTTIEELLDAMFSMWSALRQTKT
jgi:hypothetical protein